MFDGTIKPHNVDRRLVAENIPHFHTYNDEIADTFEAPTYGHRPRSASRIYNPLAHDLTRKPKMNGEH